MVSNTSSFHELEYIGMSALLERILHRGQVCKANYVKLLVRCPQHARHQVMTLSFLVGSRLQGETWEMSVATSLGHI